MASVGDVFRALPIQTEVVFSGIFCGIILLFFVIFILVAIWVYRDAESRGMNGVLWLIVVILLGLIGLIIYLVVRGDHPVRPPGWQPGYGPGYAPGYGQSPYGPQYAPPYQPPAPGQVPQAPPTAAAPPAAAAGTGTPCKSCGSPLSAGAKFCPKCGTPV